MTLKQRLMAWQNIALCLIRTWWRPATLLGVAVATWGNLVVIPLISWQLPNLADAALWITACAGLSWVREYGKIRGVKD